MASFVCLLVVSHPSVELAPEGCILVRLALSSLLQAQFWVVAFGAHFLVLSHPFVERAPEDSTLFCICPDFGLTLWYLSFDCLSLAALSWYHLLLYLPIDCKAFATSP